jgi:hypothetical protein
VNYEIRRVENARSLNSLFIEPRDIQRQGHKFDRPRIVISPRLMNSLGISILITPCCAFIPFIYTGCKLLCIVGVFSRVICTRTHTYTLSAHSLSSSARGTILLYTAQSFILLFKAATLINKRDRPPVVLHHLHVVLWHYLC